MVNRDPSTGNCETCVGCTYPVRQLVEIKTNIENLGFTSDSPTQCSEMNWSVSCIDIHDR